MRLFVITGTCGAGKSTMRDSLPDLLDPERYVCVDSDEVGLNWWDYAGTDHEWKYKDDCLAEAVRRAKEYISGALAAMLDLGKGAGPMMHNFDLKSRFAEEANESERNEDK